MSVHVYACANVYKCVCMHVCEYVCVSCQWQWVAIAPWPAADILALIPCVCCSSVTLPLADFLSSSAWASVSLSPEESWFSAYCVIFHSSSLICCCSKYHDQKQLRGGKGLFHLMLQGHRLSLKAARIGTDVEAVEECWCLALPLAHAQLTQLCGNGAIHSSLDPPM